jgi:hypothetical protein
VLLTLPAGFSSPHLGVIMFADSRRLVVLLALVLTAAAGCPGPSPVADDNDPVSETLVTGRAPLNAGGTVRITSHEGFKAGTTYERPIDDAGRFSVPMGASSGRFTLEASGGTYVEPATGTTVRHAGETLRAALVEAQAIKKVEAAITPWTELAFARGGLEGFAASLKTITDTLGCGDPARARLLLTPPALPTPNNPVQSLSVDALAYVYLGAFSQLAADLSDQLALQPGARLTSMRLAKALAADFSDGRIDGRQSGARIWLLEGHPLPDNLLRQPLAQAMRRFLNKPFQADAKPPYGNETSLHEGAALDLLKCVSLGSDLQLGATGETLDLEGPALRFVTPQAGAYLASAQDLICEAQDVSGVASLTGSLWRGPTEIPQALGLAATAIAERTTWRFRAPLRIEQTNTGALQFQCEAADAWGNKRQETHEFHVNRGSVPPRLTLSAEDRNAVAASVQVTCACAEDPYSQRCELTSPVDGGAATLMSQVDRTSTYTWDTHKILDGQHLLTCSNWTRGVEGALTQSLMARVKNHDPGSATGMVYLDTPVEHVTVTAYAYQNGTIGPELGTAEAPDGAFRLAISNEYRGPVLLEAKKSKNTAIDQPQAKFHNVPLDGPMALSNGSLRLLLEHYEPGQNFTTLSINVASSMAESLATAIWKQHLDGAASFFDAAQTGHRLVAQYLRPTRPFDARTTKVAHLGEAARVAGDDEVILGLFHVGLSRLAIEYSIEHCQRRTCITVADIVEGMRQDLSDGALDGQDLNKAQVRLGEGAVLGADFFRIELARSIRRWLDKAPFLDDPRDAINHSGLVPQNFVGRLQDIAVHDSQLFGHRPGTQYDDEGPILDVQVLNEQGKTINLKGVLGPTLFRVVVNGRDDTGVAWIHASIDGKALENSQIGKSDHAEFWVDTNSQRDGDVQIAIQSQDGNGNPTTRYINVLIDKVAPTVDLGRGEVWVRAGEDYKVTGSVSKPHLTAQIFEGEVPVTEPWELPNGDQTFAARVPINCGAHHTLTVRVRDSAGNPGEARQVVHCDDRAPTIAALPSPFIQEQGGEQIELRFRLQPDPQAIGLISVQEAPLLQKLWNRLDNRPEHEPPTLRFAVGDIVAHGIGTPVESLDVAYKYIFRGNGGVTKERSWTPIHCTREGACAIAFSYQTMLPGDMLNQPISVTRTQNFIARSKPEEAHSVLIRVKDLAGNEAMAEWSVRLQLFGPSVEIECGFSQNAIDTRLANPVTIPSVAGANFPALYSRISTSFGVDENSLTPADGSYSFSFSDTTLEWRFDRVLHQVASLGKVGAYQVDWHGCRPDPVSLQFDDGECQHLRRRNRYPRHWVTPREGHMRDLVASQHAKPQRMVADLRPGEERIDNLLLTTGQPQKDGGAVYPIIPAQLVNGAYATQFSYRTGIEADGDDRVFLKMDERSFIKDLRVIRKDVYRPEYSGSHLGTPRPIRVTYGAECASPITASWRENRAPIVRTGAPPDISDLAADYGPQP